MATPSQLKPLKHKPECRHWSKWCCKWHTWQTQLWTINAVHTLIVLKTTVENQKHWTVRNICLKQSCSVFKSLSRTQNTQTRLKRPFNAIQSCFFFLSFTMLTYHLAPSDPDCLEYPTPGFPSVGGRSFSAMAPILWNAQPQFVFDCSSIASLKLQQIFFMQYYTSLYTP